MAILREERGAALVTALMLTMLSLVISMALLYSVTMGTKISASQKRYRTALAAAQGGVELFTQEIIPGVFQATPQSTLQREYSPIDLQLPQFSCLKEKLDKPTGQWSDACKDAKPWDPAFAPDATFQLSGTSDPGFTVATKIVDSVPGNSDIGGLDYLDVGTPVSGTDEVIHPQHVPGIYDISVQGVRSGGNSSEKATLSVLYAY